MVAGIAQRMVQRRAEVVEDAVDQLQMNGPNADFAFHVRQLVAEMAEIEAPIRRMVASFQQGVQPETTPREFASAQTVGHLLNKVLSFFPVVRNLIQEVERRNDQVDRIEHLAATEAAIKLMRNEFFARWPMPDESRVQRAKEQAAAGKYHVL